MQQERRKRPRFALEVPVSLRTRGGKPAAAQLLDLSENGCRLQAITAIRPSETVWLYFADGLFMAGTVVWTHDLFAGVAFCGKLHAAVMQTLLRHARTGHRYSSQLRELSARCEHLASRCYNSNAAAELRGLSTDCKVEATIHALTVAFDRPQASFLPAARF